MFNSSDSSPEQTPRPRKWDVENVQARRHPKWLEFEADISISAALRARVACALDRFGLGTSDIAGWLRSGNTEAARGVVPFLQEALVLLPEGMWIRCVRADSGFFEEAILSFLEERKLPYLVVARMTSTLQRRCAGLKDWTVLDDRYAVGEFTVQLFGWSKARRLVVLRERVREGQDAVGRRLRDVPGYTSGCG